MGRLCIKECYRSAAAAKPLAVLSCALLLGACASELAQPWISSEPSSPYFVETPASTPNSFPILQLSTYDEDNWQHVSRRGETQYDQVVVSQAPAISARGQFSASGLFRRVNFDANACPTLRWRWRVSSVPLSARLDTWEGDDVAASISILFGDPRSFENPQPVPTLRYVWTGMNAEVGDVVVNPHMTNAVRNVVVRRGDVRLNQWVSEERDLAADYMRAFGRPPSDTVHAVAIFTDNDDTGEPASAHYGAIEVVCRSENAASGASGDHSDPGKQQAFGL